MPDDLNAHAIFEEASDLVLKPGATDKDRRTAFALVDGLNDEVLSASIRRTAADWGSGNPLANVSLPADGADAVAYDYEGEDGEE